MYILISFLLFFHSTAKASDWCGLEGDKAKLNHIYNNELILKKQDWKPKCCSQRIRRPSKTLSSDLQQLKSQCVTRERKFNARTRKNFAPGQIWDIVCDTTEKKMTFAKKGIGTFYYDGFITIHDAQLLESDDPRPEGFTKYQDSRREMQSLMEILYGLDGVSGNEISDLQHDKVDALAEIYSSRLKPGWGDSGYHFLVGRRSGKVFAARSLRFQGAHAGSSLILQEQKVTRNEGNIGVAFLGNCKRKDCPSSKAEENAKELIEFLKKQFAISNEHIISHNHVRNTDCGVHHVNQWLKDNFWDKVNSTGTPVARTPKDKILKRIADLFLSERKACDSTKISHSEEEKPKHKPKTKSKPKQPSEGEEVDL